MDTMRRILQAHGEAYHMTEYERVDGERIVQITHIMRFNAHYGNYGVWVKVYNDFGEVSKEDAHHCRNFGQVEAVVGYIAKLNTWVHVAPVIEPKRWRF